MKLGVVGVGGMGGNHCTTIVEMPQAQLTAVSDVSAEMAQKVAGETGAQPFTDYETMIREAGLDGVIIATPHYFHPPMAEYAARHGVHVLSEKPIAVSVQAADAMVKTCREAGVLLGLMFQQRLDARHLKIKQMLDAGILGPLHRISMSVPWYRSQAYYDSGAWRGTWKGEGGGILMNQAPHSIDQFLWLGGEPHTVQSIAQTRLHKIEVENTSLSILDYGTGQVGSFYVSSAEITTGEVIEISGDLGALELRDGQLRHFELKESLSDHLRESSERFAGPEGEWRDIEIEEESGGTREVIERFVAAVQNNDKSLLVASGEDGLRALELANAMLLAGYTRQEVELPLNRDQFETMLKQLQEGAKPLDFRGQDI